MEFRDKIFPVDAALWSAYLHQKDFSIFATAARRRHFMFEILARYISKMVRARASKFGSFVEGYDRYAIDFFQIFPANGRVVVEGQNLNVWGWISRKQ